VGVPEGVTVGMPVGVGVKVPEPVGVYVPLRVLEGVAVGLSLREPVLLADAPDEIVAVGEELVVVLALGVAVGVAVDTLDEDLVPVPVGLGDVVGVLVGDAVKLVVEVLVADSEVEEEGVGVGVG